MTNFTFLAAFLRRLIGTAFALFVLSVSFHSYSALAEDSIGTATFKEISCPATGLANGTCYKVTISGCPESTGDFIAAVKVNVPPNGKKSIGSIFFTTGGGGSAFYDDFSDFIKGDKRCNQSGNCGLFAVEAVNSAGYKTIQTNFSDPDSATSEPVGWLTGPAADGPRALACRYATLAHAVWMYVLGSDTTRPVCATGNSGGSSAVAYGLTQYGLGSSSGPGPVFSMVEASSGPVMAKINRGCAKEPIEEAVTCPNGTVLAENYGLTIAEAFIDPTYDRDVDTTPDSEDICSLQIEGGGNKQLFLHDSVVSDDFPSPSYPETFVKVVFGSEDLSSAVPQGLEWYNAITSSKAQACVAGASHEIAASYAGATQIADDLISSCKLQ